MNVMFSADDFRGDITAVVFQPNQKIYRWDRESNTPYYVFMSRDTIRKMLMKLSRLKPKNLINYEHSGMVFDGDDVYTYENWLVGDNPQMDKSYEIFVREFEPGTWITTIHFKDRRIFDEFVLSQKASSISLEGMFEEVPFNFFDVKQEDFIDVKPGESESDYVSRCVSSSKMMGEFPDEEQRLAVCYSQYKQKFNFPEGTCWEGYEPYGTKIVDGREVPNCVPIKATEEFITEYIPYDELEDQYCNCDYGYTAIGFKIGDSKEYRCVEENSEEAIDYNAAQLVMKLEALLKEMDKSIS